VHMRSFIIYNLNIIMLVCLNQERYAYNKCVPIFWLKNTKKSGKIKLNWILQKVWSVNMLAG
jgi:hypothetical protein